MKASIFFMLIGVLCIPHISFAQPSVLFGYSNLRSPELDKVIQLYNFSRPWQENKLVPLMNGYGINAGWFWKIQKARQIHLLPELGYMRFGTSAENFDRSYAAGFHKFSVGVGLRFHPKSLIKTLQNAGVIGTRWFVSIVPAYSFYLPYVRINKEALMVSENIKYRELTSSFCLSLGTGYNVTSIGRFIITPEISATWFPSMELGNFITAVNGHNITGMSNKFSNVLFLNAGLRITMVKLHSNWWDRPREGDHG